MIEQLKTHTHTHATGEEWKNSSRKGEEVESKQKRCPSVVVYDGESKAQCCKEKCCIETWNLRSMNQDKLDVIKQETARVKTAIL